MKIFFTVARSGIEIFGEDYEKVLKELKRQKASVVATLDKSYLTNNAKLKSIKGLSVAENDYRYVHDFAPKKCGWSIK